MVAAAVQRIMKKIDNVLLMSESMQWALRLEPQSAPSDAERNGRFFRFWADAICLGAADSLQKWHSVAR